jgi:hypothetical protein
MFKKYLKKSLKIIESKVKNKMKKSKKKTKKPKPQKDSDEESKIEEEESENPKYLSFWMSNLPPSILMRDLIIPGCHAANSYDLNQPKLMVGFARCQKLKIKEQLESGVRYLDLRYGIPNKKVFRKLEIDK